MNYSRKNCEKFTLQKNFGIPLMIPKFYFYRLYEIFLRFDDK